MNNAANQKIYSPESCKKVFPILPEVPEYEIPTRKIVPWYRKPYPGLIISILIAVGYLLSYTPRNSGRPPLFVTLLSSNAQMGEELAGNIYGVLFLAVIIIIFSLYFIEIIFSL